MKHAEDQKCKVEISIITVAYNAERTIERTIQSVLAQTYPPKEYYIIDGASKDRTVAIAERYKDRFQKRGVSYCIISEPDRGMYDALNKGARMVSGDLIGQINSDDWYEPIALEKVAKLYQREPFDMTYADLRMIQPNGQTWIKRAKLSKFVNSRHWNHPTQFARRDLLLAHPYACQCMSDDLDFMLWVHHHGYKIVIQNEVLANFTMEGMSHSKNLPEIMDRIKTKANIYRRNGYSWVHAVDIAVVEFGKLIVGMVGSR